MEPQTPTPNNVVQPSPPGSAPNYSAPDGGQPPQQTPGWQASSNSPSGNNQKKKKLIIIGLVALLIIIVGIALIKPLLSKKDKNSGDTSMNNDIYHMREGYDIKQYGSSIGDPLALNMDKLDKVVSSDAGPIIYACNILTMKELNAQKTYVATRADTRGIIRNFIDGVGKAAVTPSKYTLPSGDDENNCNYGLEAGGILTISVLQTPFITEEALTDDLERSYTQTDSIGGLTTYEYKRSGERESSATYMLVSGKNALQILFNGTKINTDNQKSLLALAAKNFTAEQTTPKGPAIPVYDTPTYKQKYARACDLISNDDIKALTGTDASAYATEGLATGTGVDKVNDRLYNSISTSCSRFNTGLGSGLTPGPFNQELEVTVTSFNDDAPAQYYMEATEKKVKNKTDAAIGDKGFGYQDTAKQNTVLFRQGRFIVELMFNRTLQKNAGLEDTAAMVQKLTPYGQQVAAKLKPIQ